MSVRRRAAVDAAEIAGFAAVVITLIVTIFIMDDAKDQVTVLQDLVESNINQTKAMQELLLETQHQTILNAYANGGMFDLVIDHCSTSGEKHDADGNFINRYISFKPIMVSESGAQTIVPFRIFADLVFEGKESRGDIHGNRLFKAGLSDFQYNTNNEASAYEYGIQEILDDASTQGFDFVEITYQYSFRPYSPLKENFRIADQSETVEMPLAIMEFKYDAWYWHGLDIPGQYPCRS